MIHNLFAIIFFFCTLPMCYDLLTVIGHFDTRNTFIEWEAGAKPARWGPVDFRGVGAPRAPPPITCGFSNNVNTIFILLLKKFDYVNQEEAVPYTECELILRKKNTINLLGVGPPVGWGPLTWSPLFLW